MKIKLDTKKIYLAMAEKGMTITEIAQQGWVSQQAVSNALNGNRVGKVKVVPAICAALGFKAQDIECDGEGSCRKGISVLFYADEMSRCVLH